MNIQPLKTECVSLPAKPKAQAAKPTQASSPNEPLQSTKNERLMNLLRNEPEVRATEVERGKALAADPNYPSDDIFAKLAEIFVNDAKRAK
jgi:hypothetical protein